jgi:lipid-A-disaccharide synthase
VPIPVFFLTAAEHSGDALGASLIGALKRRYPEARFVGVGGEKMASAGCRLLADPVKRSAMLVGAFLTESRFWWRLLRQIRTELATLKPDVVIPIDSSAINLRIARIAKEQQLPVCYYVAPQVWASRPWRVKKIKACVDTLCCVLPFEEKYFQERGVRGVYVGHPMFDTAADTPETDPTRLDPPLPGMKSPAAPLVLNVDAPGGGAGGAAAGGSARGAGSRRLAFAPVPSDLPNAPAAPRIAIFPGSRRAEVDAHMPPMLTILSEIKGRFSRATFVAAAPSEERAWQIRHHLRTANTPVDIRVGSSDAIIRWADLVIVKSGTGTLQVARHGKPMVVLFAVPRWQWAVAKHFILTPHIALVNILAGRELVPEYIPLNGSPLPVARECIELLSRPELRAAMAKDLRVLVEPLQPPQGEGGPVLAADRVAEQVSKLVKS